MAYLEKLRSDKLRMACVHIQKTIRCWLARKKYLRMKESAIIIQRHVRGHQARRYVDLTQQQNKLFIGNRKPSLSFCQLCQVSAKNQSSCCHSAQRANVGDQETVPATAFCSCHHPVLPEGLRGQEDLL